MPASDTPIDALKAIVKQLRAPGGCPWDIEQTPQSISPHIIEEAYELVEAIDSHDNQRIIDELSDQLLHVVMIAEIIHESGGFNFDDVANHCSKKMIDRHPHVFGTETAKTSTDVENQWELRKAKQSPNEHMLDDIPNQLPALMHAQKLQKKVASIGFDWPSIDGALEKLNEECQELIQAPTTDNMNEEIGDILFSIVNICRKLDTSAEQLLQHANKKFKTRFKRCETIARQHNKALNECTPEELDLFWDQAKKIQPKPTP